MRNVSILLPEQLEIEEIIKRALGRHYGERQMPIPVDKLFVKRQDIFEKKFLGANKVVKFFEKAVSADDPFRSNVHEATLPDNKFRVLTGMQILQAESTGLNGVDGINTAEKDKNWGPAAETAIRNGLVSLKINNRDIIEKQQIQSFVNDDGIKSFLRFAKVVVQEPNEKIELETEFPDAVAGNKHLQITLTGWIIER